MHVLLRASILLLSQIVVASGGELLLVQAVSRNGDRNPTKVCENDKNNAESWNQGLGWLSQMGMRQQFDFGSLIHDEYVKKYNFMNERYDAREVYFYSADTNRTLLSAQSHALGMYYNRSALVADVDFPASDGWPHGYVPVPVHTDKPVDDYVGNMANCKRADYLIDLVHQTSEYKEFLQNVTSVLESASQKCGEQGTLAPSDVSLITHSWIQENSTGRETLFSADEFAALRAIEKTAKRFKNGRENLKSGSIELSVELPSLRSGSLLWDIIDRMHLKINCLSQSNANEAKCKWANTLKYYSYSVKCDTLYSLLVMVDPEYNILGKYELPDFATSLVFELWSISSDSSDFEIKVRYYTPASGTLEDVTTKLNGCSSEPCTLSLFESALSKYKFSREIQKVCNDVPSKWKQNDEFETAKETMDSVTADNVILDDDGNQLIFVQTLWRHGDRTPLGRCENENITEEDWPNGYSQLTAIGMEQHRIFGTRIYERYVNDLGFLSERFDSNEIYMHSTGFNRTIMSSLSNLLGMYHNRGNATKGVDYPAEGIWPHGFVPVPVHSFDPEHDYMGDPDHTVAKCARQLALTDAAANFQEIKQFEFENQKLLDNASEVCGHQLELMTLADPLDAYYVEQIYNKSRIFSEDMYEKLYAMDNVAENIRNGLLVYNHIYNGLDVRVEIARLRGGSALFNFINHAQLKIFCEAAENSGKSECSWMSKLKYFSFSAHDSTVNGVLSTLGLKERVVPKGIPEYTGAVIFELWRTPQQTYQIKVLYHRTHKTTLWENITPYVQGCISDEAMCPFEQFVQRSLSFNPDDIIQSCADVHDLPTSSPSTEETPFSVTTSSRGISSTPYFGSAYALVILLLINFVVI